jgi:hypothetical protein
VINSTAKEDHVTAATCPAWCNLDHAREPVGNHSGVVRLGPDISGVNVFLTRLPGEEGTSVVLVPVGFTGTFQDDGLGISLDAELTGELARVLATA